MATLTLMPSQEKSVRVCCRREERGWYLGTSRRAILTSTEGLADMHREVALPEAEKDLRVEPLVCVSGKQEDVVCSVYRSVWDVAIEFMMRIPPWDFMG